MIDIVIPYVLGPNNGLELRYALRSIAKHFKSKHRIWIVGDIPSWCINVEHVPIIRPENKPYRAFMDTTSKVYHVLKNKPISDDFIYMYDDTYFTNDCQHLPNVYHLQDLAKIEEIKWFSESKAGSRWIELALRTFLFLKQNEKTLFNCETHLPRTFNKAKLISLIEQFDLCSNPLQLSTFYYNWENIKSEEISPDIKVGIYSDFNAIDVIEKCKSAKFLNFSAQYFNTKMKIVLAKLFPEKCKYEK